MLGNKNSTRIRQMIMVGDVHQLRRLNCYPKFYRIMINILFLGFHRSFQKILVLIYFCYPKIVSQVLAKLTTHFIRVHSRQCRDEAELAEHVVGLTSGLASCQFRYIVPVCTFLLKTWNWNLIGLQVCTEKNTYA